MEHQGTASDPQRLNGFSPGRAVGTRAGSIAATMAANVESSTRSIATGCSACRRTNPNRNEVMKDKTKTSAASPDEATQPSPPLDASTGPRSACSEAIQLLKDCENKLVTLKAKTNIQLTYEQSDDLFTAYSFIHKVRMELDED